MIALKSPRDLLNMRRACRIAAKARELAGSMVCPGVTTEEINRAAHAFISAEGAYPSFLNYNGFPAALCISVNETVIHGIPGGRVLKDGDIVSIDVGAHYEGFHGDCAETFPCGNISEEARRLITVTRESFYRGIAMAVEGNRVSDISYAVQSYVEAEGYSVVRDFVGHGLGRQLHEAPEVPNYGAPGRGVRLRAGMTIAVEPMVNAGGYGVRILPDGWTVLTEDGSLSAHYENSILVTKAAAEILTTTEELI